MSEQNKAPKSRLRTFWNKLATTKKQSPQSPSRAEVDAAEFEQACQFLTLLVQSAYRYGASASSVGALFSQLPNTLGLSGEILIAPPFLLMNVRHEEHDQQRALTVRLPKVAFDLTKLSLVGNLMDQLTAEKITLVDATAQLANIESRPVQFGVPVIAAAYALCGAGIGAVLSESWIGIMVSALLSLVIFAVLKMISRYPRLSDGLEVIAALVASMLATLSTILIPGMNQSTLTLCAVIVLVPGLSLTSGVGELVAKSILSGLDRLMDGIIITVKLFVGASLGVTIISKLWTVPPSVASAGIPTVFKWCFVALLVVGLGAIFQSRPKDMGWIALAGIVAYGGNQIGSQFGLWQGPFLGALLLGIYGALFSHFRHQTSSTVMLPGVLILVPGIAAYLGLNVLGTSGIISGLAAFWGVLVQIVAIITGLITAASITPHEVSL